MSKYCLIQPLAKKFKNMITEGKITPDSLNGMTSKQRYDFFRKNFGNENAKNMNVLVERNLMMKNRERALIRWAKEVGNIKPELKQDIFSKIDRMVKKDKETLAKMKAGEDTDKLLLSPKNQDEFLSDLAESKLGVNVTYEEAKNITKLSKKLAKQEEKITPTMDKIEQINSDLTEINKKVIKRDAKNIKKNIKELKKEAKKATDEKEINEFLDSIKDFEGELKNKEKMLEFAKSDIAGRKRLDLIKQKKELLKGKERLDYGAAKVQMEDYLNELKERNVKGIWGTIQEKGVPGSILAGANYVGGLAKSLKATLDNSAVFRQGWKTMFSHPIKWAKNMPKTFMDIGKELIGIDALKAVKADIYSRPNAVNGLYRKMKLDVGITEEAFPVDLPSKIPILKRFYKSSESAYTGFLYRMRADVADKYLDAAQMAGVNINDATNVQGIGRMVNSLTGRGDLGSAEPAGKTFNALFFSLKNLKSNTDFLTMHMFQKQTGWARKRAAINLLKTVVGTGLVLKTADSVGRAFGLDNVVEWDPRSSDFGKVRVGDTRFDVSAGMGSIIVLAGRLFSGSSKSSMTGNITELNSGDFGALTRWDVVQNFTENKFSPTLSAFKSFMKGETFGGDPVTVKSTATDLFAPLPITNAIETMKNPNSANALAVMIADGLGIGTNTYSFEAEVNLDAIKTEKMDRLREQLGEEKYDEVKAEHAERLGEAALELRTSERYKKAKGEEQKAMMDELNDRYMERLYVENDIWDKDEDPIEARKKYEVGKKVDEYIEKLDKGQSTQSLTLSLKGEEDDIFVRKLRDRIKGEDKKRTGESYQRYLNSFSGEARTRALNDLILKEVLTSDDAVELVKVNKEFRSFVDKTDYSDLNSEYRSAKADMKYAEMKGLSDSSIKAKIKALDKKDSNYANAVERRWNADRYDLDEEEASLLSYPSYEKRAEVIVKKTAKMSESEQKEYMKKMTDLGVVPSGLTKTGRYSKYQAKRKARFMKELEKAKGGKPVAIKYSTLTNDGEIIEFSEPDKAPDLGVIDKIASKLSPNWEKHKQKLYGLYDSVFETKNEKEMKRKTLEERYPVDEEVAKVMSEGSNLENMLSEESKYRGVGGETVSRKSINLTLEAATPDLLTKITNKLQKGQDLVNIGYNNDEIVMHELVHVYHNKKGLKDSPEEINKSWENSDNPDIKKIDKTLKDSGLYENIDKETLADERIAYLISAKGKEGIKNIPYEMRKYVDHILKPEWKRKEAKGEKLNTYDKIEKGLSKKGTMKKSELESLIDTVDDAVLIKEYKKRLKELYG